MRYQFADALKGHDADYVEIRFEESQTTSIVYRGESLEEIGRAQSSGGILPRPQKIARPARKEISSGPALFATTNAVGHHMKRQCTKDYAL